MTILAGMKTISDLENALEELKGQTEASDASESLIAKLCSSNDIPVDLRVASLLRLMAIDSKLIYDSSHRKKSLDIILNRLEITAPSVLTNYKIDKKTQADEQCNKLANLEPDAMKSFNQSLDKYNGINRVVDFRQQLLKGINHEIVKIALHPFLNLGADPTESLKRCLQAVVNYSQADLKQARSTFNTGQIELETIIVRLNEIPTKPGILISELLKTIQGDLKDYFEASPFSKQAYLEIHPTLRKYPLHVKDIELLISLEIRNIGKGIAFDVEIGLIESIGLLPVGSVSRISDIALGSMIVEIPALTDPNTIDRGVNATCEFHLSWVNTDGTSEDKRITVDLEPQDYNIAWDDSRYDDPYSLEPVTQEDDLIGRSEILDRIIGILTTPAVGSLYIFGQKRVGKTSLAKVALKQMGKIQNTLCIFINIGTIATPDPVRAINKLTERLVRTLKRQIPATENFEFKADDSLTPLSDILEMSTLLGSRVIIALDEFDVLPFQLFRRTPEGGAFFANLRAISSIEGVGIILIGGERMSFIINGPPSIELNKFVPFPIGILDRETQWRDFELLIKNPAKYLDFSEKAISLIYDYTAGHPYYTKLLCAKILKGASERRDSYIDDREVNSALGYLFREIDSTSFSHYWEDYILEEESSQEEIISSNRKRCLVAFSKACDIKLQAPLESVYTESLSLGLDILSSKRIMEQYDQRGIFKIYDQTVEPRIKLFGHWITKEGKTLTATRSETEQEKLRVTSEEITQLIKDWDSYRGKFITDSIIDEFLEQFDTPLDRRIIFKILQNLYFVGGMEEEQLWKSAFQKLQYSLKERDGSWQRGQIRISYVGYVGKSSNAMARSFASANGFLKDIRGIVRPSQVKNVYKEGISDIVICDDFVGTGQTLSNDLEKFYKFIMPEQRIHIFILAGMPKGIDCVTNRAHEIYGMDRMSVRCLVELDTKSEILSKFTTEEANQAERLLQDFGSRLEPKQPLGYGGCCSLITFARTIPNNAPPILWKESTGDFKFQPLFPRL